MNMRSQRRASYGDPQRVFGQLVARQLLRRARRAPGARPRIPARGRHGRRMRIRSSVFSHNFWQRRFAGDPVDRRHATVTLNGRAFTVIGVAPAGFRGTEPYLNLDMLGADDDAVVGHERRRSPERPRQLLARGDGEAEAGRRHRPRAGRPRCRRARSGATRMPTTKDAA